MAYNNGFPVNYPQYYPQYQQAPMPGAQMSLANQMSPASMSGTPNNYQNGTSSIIWVQGEAGAKSYLVSPNTTVQLWDSEEQVIYLKSADASGMPSMKILDYKVRENNSQNAIPAVISDAKTEDYVTKEEFIAFEEKMRKQIEKLSARPKKEIKDDE
jgi:hypothetical protein